MAAISSLILGGLSFVGRQVQASREARARREANRISGNQEANRSAAARQRNAREERVRRARLVAMSSAQGTLGSSGVIGATSALGINFASARAGQRSQTEATLAISAANQKAADARGRYNFFADLGSLSNTISDSDLFS